MVARVAVAAILAAALIAGILNLRPIVDRLTGGDSFGPAAPSAVDTLTGAPERPQTALDAQILALQESLRDADPRAKGEVSTRLGEAYLQKARETGDPGYYPKAEALFGQALAADPEHADALVGLGTLALARHQFSEALDWGQQALAINPHHAATYGVIGDAEIELGRYDDAVRTVQAMVDLRPDLGSYARVSYLRELMGDRAGAIVAMEQAGVAGSGYPENVAWAHVQLGNLRFDGGDLAGAKHDFDAAAAAAAGYAPAMAGQARVAAARGDLDRAAALYKTAVQQIPLPEFLVAYGDVLNAADKTRDAEAQFALVEAIQGINSANGVDTDLELALFVADHGDPADLPQAVAQARAGVETRPSVVAWDVLAWTLFRSGDVEGAAAASQKALRLGTQNALMHFHAGMIADANSDRDRAISHLETALDINPYFSIRFVPEARTTLERLQGEEGVR